MNRITPQLPSSVLRFAKFFAVLKYFSEHYFVYLFVGAILWAQWRQSQIKSSALIALYYTQAVETSVTAIETNQRGYLYTGDPELYPEYIRAKASYVIASKRLAHALASDADDAQRFARVTDIVNSKIGEMDQTIAYYRSGKEDEARRIVLTRQGQRYMASIRQVLSEIRTAREIRAIAAMGTLLNTHY